MSGLRFHSQVVRTEVVLELTEHPDTFGAMVAVAELVCQEVHPFLEFEGEEYGVSGINMEWVSQPYARLGGGVHGEPGSVAPLYSASYGWLDPEASLTASDEPETVDADSRLRHDHLAGRVGSDVRIRLTGSSAETTPTHTTVSTLTLVVVASNDFGYAVDFASEWLMTQAIVDTVEPYTVPEHSTR